MMLGDKKAIYEVGGAIITGSELVKILNWQRPGCMPQSFGTLYKGVVWNITE